MFANALRVQARVNLFSASRLLSTSTRTLSLSVSRGASVAGKNVASRPALTSTRAFSQSAISLFERERRVKNPPSNVLFVGNLPWTATEESVREILQDFGEIERVTLQTNSEGRPRGFGHVTFASKEQAVSACESAAQEPITLADRDLVLDYALSRESAPNTNIFFGNFDGDANALRNILQEHNENIVDVVFMRDGNTGLPLASGFVRMSSLESSAAALAVLSTVKNADGQALRVNYARPRSERDQRKKFVERRPRYGGGEREGSRYGGEREGSRYGGGEREGGYKREHYSSRGDRSNETW